jgi:hypothetical protein
MGKFDSLNIFQSRGKRFLVVRETIHVKFLVVREIFLNNRHRLKHEPFHENYIYCTYMKPSRMFDMCSALRGTLLWHEQLI